MLSGVQTLVGVSANACRIVTRRRLQETPAGQPATRSDFCRCKRAVQDQGQTCKGDQGDAPVLQALPVYRMTFEPEVILGMVPGLGRAAVDLPAVDSKLGRHLCREYLRWSRSIKVSWSSGQPRASSNGKAMAIQIG